MLRINGLVNNKNLDMYKKFLKQDPNNWKWLIAIHVVVYSIMLILMLDF